MGYAGDITILYCEVNTSRFTTFRERSIKSNLTRPRKPLNEDLPMTLASAMQEQSHLDKSGVSPKVRGSRWGGIGILHQDQGTRLILEHVV